MGLFTRRKELAAYHSALKHPSGYYYVQYTHDYTGLTDSELDSLPDFCKLQLAKFEHINLDFVNLDESKREYIQDGQRIIFYAKIGSRIIGRINLEVYMLKDNLYKANITYLTHQIIPHHAKIPKIKPLKSFDDINNPAPKHKYNTKERKVK